MIDALMPTLSCAEMFSDAPESTMFSSEAVAVLNAAAERRGEFCTVRFCAREAMQQIGVPAATLLPDGDGVPRWPLGVVGSMTHCPGYRAAVVAQSAVLGSVGIDAEPNAALPDSVSELVMCDEERADVLRLSNVFTDVHWDRVLFSAKEAVYKAWFPLTRRWLDFNDVSMTLRPDGTFHADVREGGPRVVDTCPDTFAGRWMVGRGLVVTATTVSHHQAAAEPAERTGVGLAVHEQKLAS